MAVVLITPAVNSWTEYYTFENESENREWAKKPVLALNVIDSFPDRYEAYYNDHFSFRKPLLDINSKIKFDYFKISPHPENSLVGKDGYYFMSRKEKLIYEGRFDFSKGEMDSLKGIWNYRKEYLDSLDIPFYWLIAPLKHYVYSDKLPFNVVPAKNGRRTDVLIKYLEKDLGNFIVDPKPLLKQIGEETKMFYQQDNHWNERAGFNATKYFLEFAKKDFPQLKSIEYDDFDWIDSTKVGGIHQSFMGVSEFAEPEIWAKDNFAYRAENYGFPLEEAFPYPSDFEHRFLNKNNDSLPKILVIRDSFAQQMIPFINASFSESVYIFDSWQYKLNKHIIEEYKPDLILFIGLETHIENILVDSINMLKLAE